MRVDEVNRKKGREGREERGRVADRKQSGEREVEEGEKVGRK